MKKKKRFVQAVEILAPEDQFIFEAAQQISEEKLPSCPGATALEFLVGLARLEGCSKDQQPDQLKEGKSAARASERSLYCR